MSARTTAAEASARVRAYLERHAKNRQGDPVAIHGYDLGEASEAVLLIADLKAIIDRPLLSKGFIVGKKGSGSFSHVIAVFDTRDLAVAWAENANAWYGEDHPLTPLTVWNGEEVFINPKPFPAPNASVEEMFADIDQ